MLHNATGHKETDHFKSMDLCRSVLQFAQQWMMPGGSVLCKYLRGADEKELLTLAKSMFANVKSVKPKASRSESAEAYLLAQGMKGK